jgi:hypothetical protein
MLRDSLKADGDPVGLLFLACKGESRRRFGGAKAVASMFFMVIALNYG